MKILSGPFKGMGYVPNSTGGAYFPKLLGTYELELHPIVKRLGKIDFAKVINVGSGEGYFSVGFALNIPNARVISFDPSFYGCFLHNQMAEINNVRDRITIKAEFCTTELLSKFIDTGENSLIFMDVEGSELELLNSSEVPGLKNSHILVEIHDSVSPLLGNTILERFENSHSLEIIYQRDRTLNDLPFRNIFTALFPKQFIKLLDEGRGYKMRWFYFAPLA